MGTSSLAVYRSQFAGTNKAAAVNWDVCNAIDDVVARLKTDGVEFEHYDMPGITRQGDLHVGGAMKVAWFKDPDSNIHNVHNGGNSYKGVLQCVSWYWSRPTATPRPA